MRHGYIGVAAIVAFLRYTPHSSNPCHHATSSSLPLFTRNLDNFHNDFTNVATLHKQTQKHHTHIVFFHFNSFKSQFQTIHNMSNLDGDSSPKIHVETPPTAPSAPNESNRTPATNGGGIGGILRRWEREDLMKRASLGLRGIALLFSLISFIIMASNKHGDWRDFDKYEEYRYLLAIAILSSLYTGGQAFRQIHELSTAKQLLKPRMAAMIDFFGDQIIAYLLISSASSAVPLTNRMREGADNIFTDASSSAISMSIFSFLCLAVSALISGYKLSTRPYI